MLPALIWGTWISDSFVNNLAWTEGVSVEMQRGAFYPRWLSTGFDGFGSPSFYFYPPLPFLFTGAAAAFFHPQLSFATIIQFYAFVVMVASGWSMYFWLKHFVQQRFALLGGLIYMAMPYHLTDHYTRGALGEFTTYAIIPLLMVCIHSMAGPGRRNVAYFAIIYSSLVLAHLPTAVLVTFFLVPPFSLWTAAHAPKPVLVLVKIASGGILGAALSAAYLMPALSLQSFISSGRLWESRFQPEFWFLNNINEIDDLKIVVTLLIYILLLLTLMVYWMRVKKRASIEIRDASFFFLVAIAILALILGLVPWVWQFPVLAKVQFPWRALVLVDFLSVSAFVICFQNWRQARNFISLAVLFLVFAVVSVTNGAYIKRYITIGVERASQNLVVAREPLEYLGPGCAKPDSNSRFEAILIPANAGEVSVYWKERALIVDISTSKPAQIILPQHYFPSWELIASSGTIPAITQTGGYCLVSFEAPPGISRFTLRQKILSPERIGWLVSVGSFLQVIIIIIFGRPKKTKP